MDVERIGRLGRIGGPRDYPHPHKQSQIAADKNVYNYYRNRALGYNPVWVSGCGEQNYLRAGDRLKRHMFLGCCQLLNLCGPVTEVTKWKFPKD